LSQLVTSSFKSLFFNLEGTHNYMMHVQVHPPGGCDFICGFDESDEEWWRKLKLWMMNDELNWIMIYWFMQVIVSKENKWLSLLMVWYCGCVCANWDCENWNWELCVWSQVVYERPSWMIQSVHDMPTCCLVINIGWVIN